MHLLVIFCLLSKQIHIQPSVLGFILSWLAQGQEGVQKKWLYIKFGGMGEETLTGF